MSLTNTQTLSTTSIDQEKKPFFDRGKGNMKIKNKGKVYPSPPPPPPSSSFSTRPNEGDVLSVLKLLPAAILALASVLSLEDREVLAYMLTRSLKTSSATTSSSSLGQESKKKSSKKASNSNNTHKPLVFACDCFDCYRSYWFRWNSSPNCELIHQVIEAFEDHLTDGEKSKKNGGRGKRREKMGHRETQKPLYCSQAQPEAPLPDKVSREVHVSLEKDIVSPEKSDGFKVNDEKEETKQVDVAVKEKSEDMTVVVRTTEVSSHRGLARKVLPDVLGILNSRLWSLWSPNV